MKRITKKRWLFVLCTLLLISTFPLRADAEENESLWRDCKYTTTNRSREGLREVWDTNPSSDYVVKGPGELTISWEDQIPAKSLYLEWNILPNDFTLTQHRKDGSVVAAASGETYQLNQLYAISEDARSITLASPTNMDICTAVVYGPNTIPKGYHPWNATPAKLDYLIIVAHPDDDVIFMGAIIPTYGVERGLNGTIVYTCSSNIRYRCNEALNGAWVMGLRNHPIFANFPDILPSQREKWEFQFKLKKLTEYYVRIIRQYKPEVMISHDTEGEYGHWQHKNVSKAVCEAVISAADATYDPESVRQYGVFQVKKLYLHLYPENKIKLDVMSPLQEFNYLNIVDISRSAFQQHISQAQASHYDDNNDGVYSLSDFGLYYSSVGADTTGSDMFENIDPELLSNYIPPTPMPTLTPRPAVVLTDTSLAGLPNKAGPVSTPPDLGTVQRTLNWLLGLLIILSAAVVCLAAVLMVSVHRSNTRKHSAIKHSARKQSKGKFMD
ncbi:MAG: hypothetical protein GX417_13175 [Clostridiales bacterium]|nr:hypothetical protein [Clostridiales bacterium]